MPSKLNQLAKTELQATFAKVPSAIFVDFTGVGSSETYELRKALAQGNMKLRVVKTSIAKIALKELGTTLHDAGFKGSLGLVYHKDDPVAVAKLILAHRKKFRGSTLKVKGGFLDRKALKAEEVTDLSNLPDKKQLIGQVVGTIAAPLASYVNVHASILRKLVYGIDAIREKKEKAGGA